MMRTAPPGLPNVYLIDVTAANHDGVMDIAAASAGSAGHAGDDGVGDSTDSISMAYLCGVKLEGHGSRRYAREISVGVDANPKDGQVSVAEQAAKVLNFMWVRRSCGRARSGHSNRQGGCS